MPFDPWVRDGKKFGSGIKSKHTGAFFGLKILKFFVVDPDPGSVAFMNLGSGKESSVSGINIPDPLH